MVRVFGVYPRAAGATFDFDYYTGVHLPMVKERLTPFGLRRIEVNRAVAGAHGEEPPNVCISFLEFDTVEGMQEGFAEHLEELGADVPNYTNIEVQIQICEVVAG